MKAIVRSSATSIAPTAPSAISSRSHWKLAMMRLKPSCSSPSRFSSGTKASSKATVAGVRGVPAELVELARRDALAASTMRKLRPPWPPSPVVLTAVT